VADDLDAECAGAWRDYDSALAEHYTRYFERHPELRGEHRYSARDLAAALPPDSSDLADLVAPGELHRHHLSGKSSQTLAVGLLGVSARLDPSLAWLWDALAPLPPASTPAPRISFEQRLARDVLGEQPRPDRHRRPRRRPDGADLHRDEVVRARAGLLLLRA
jgi:hypothetical protein